MTKKQEAPPLKLSEWIRNRLDGIKLHSYNETPDRSTGALVFTVDHGDISMSHINEWGPGGWDTPLKNDQAWAYEDDIIEVLQK